MRQRRRWFAAGVVALVSFPAISQHDSFPVSSYPVYATVRPRQEQFDLAYGITVGGERRELSMHELAATDDPLLARSRLRQTVAAGRIDDLCSDVAGRVSGDVETVVVVSATVDVVDMAAGRGGVLAEQEVGRCSTRP